MVRRVFEPLEATIKRTPSVEDKIRVLSEVAAVIEPKVHEWESLATNYKLAAENLLRGHMLMLAVAKVEQTGDRVALGERRRVFVGGIKLFESARDTCGGAIASLKKWHGHTRGLNELILRALPAIEQLKDSNGLLKVFAEQTIVEIDEKIRQ